MSVYMSVHVTVSSLGHLWSPLLREDLMGWSCIFVSNVQGLCLSLSPFPSLHYSFRVPGDELCCILVLYK